MPRDRLAGDEVDALLFGASLASKPEQEGIVQPARPYRYPRWPKCARCRNRDGAVISWNPPAPAKMRRLWLCYWCWSEIDQGGVTSNA